MTERKPSKVIAVGAAAQLWKLYGFKSPAELVLEDLALARGVIVIEEALDRAEARLVRRGSQGLIRVRRDIPERGRKRFAVAHELGHWMLHEKESQVAACTEQHMVTKYKASPLEVEATYFAAELLMPEKLVVPRLKGMRPSFQLVSQLAAEFDTTLTATAIRMVDVSKDYWAIVVSEGGSVKWWRGSEDFEDAFWIEAGSLVSEDTAAGAVFGGARPPQGPQEVESEHWAECRGGHEHERLLEEVFHLPAYDQVLSLLYLP